eukprot:TRINITY_DN5790_c0_g1_i1.p1 TRINITY_DN5790_c0_g1~~TRINITY_DN5790_c0_g1_i1.p1  ORF type:complete len:417 (+),score=87.43 TRINITY_DN5790_c0_g1_i1:116-1366(+)
MSASSVMSDDRWQKHFGQKDIEYKQSLSSSSFHPRRKDLYDQTKPNPPLSLSQSQKIPNSNSMLSSSSFVASEDLEDQLEMDFPTDLTKRKYSRKFMLDLAQEYPLPQCFQMVESITSEETLLPVRKQLKQDDDAKLKMYNQIAPQKMDKETTKSGPERVEAPLPVPLPPSLISTSASTSTSTITITPKQEDSLWFYLDPKKVQQGPFTSSQMEKWLKQNFFRLDLWVKKMEENVFSPLYVVFQRENRNPFTLVPLSLWLVQTPPSVFQQDFIQMLNYKALTRSAPLPGNASSLLQNANNLYQTSGDTPTPAVLQTAPAPAPAHVPAPTSVTTTSTTSHSTATNLTQPQQELNKQNPARIPPQKKKQYREKQNPSSLNQAQLVSNPFPPKIELFPPQKPNYASALTPAPKPVAIKK